MHCSPRNIALGIWNDEELKKLTRKTVIRDSGAKVILPKSYMPRIEREEETGAVAGSFDLVFMDMLKAAPKQILIDPRDGCHKGLLTKNGLKTICSLPALDAACANTKQSRQRKALAALTDEQRSAFNSGAYCCQYGQGKQTAEAQHAHLHAARHLRIQAVRNEQSSTQPLFDYFAFDRLTREIAENYR